MTEKNENIVKIWFVGNNDTEHPDMILENCEVKRYNGGLGIFYIIEGKIVDMFVPYHNLNALSWIKAVE
jgi:hypothetical protein